MPDTARDAQLVNELLRCVALTEVCVGGGRCESMGKEVVYVSGRVRAPGEMNGKSGNLNNALAQIYPKEYAIPGNEVVCVFDADQVAKRDFFLKTLPYFDAGAQTASLLQFP